LNKTTPLDSKYESLQPLARRVNNGEKGKDEQLGENVKNIIGLALQRKQISKSYHYGAYPSFMKSNGPYSVYDHAAVKGQQYVYNLQETFNQAHDRFKAECEEIKELKEDQKKFFKWEKKRLDDVVRQK
jgi:hypothetical protein